MATTVQDGAADGRVDAAPAAPAGAHFVLLDAGRGVAAIAVLVLHLGNEAGVHLIGHGFLAVDFFLMLSGFVIARAYERKLADGRLSLPAFLGIRFARLWPVIVAGGVLASLSMWAWPIPDWAPGPWLAWQFLLIPSAVWLLFPANAPLWSLFYETIANILHAAALWRVPARALAVAGVVLVAGAIGYAGVTGEYDVGFRPGEEAQALLRVLASYVAGILLWRWLGRRATPLPSLGWPLPFALILAPLFVPEAAPDAVALAIALPCFAAAILASLGPGPRSAPARRVMGWLGGISYPLYAVHMPVMKLGFALWRPGAPVWLQAAGWVALGAAALLVASVIESCWDAPIRDRVRAWRSARAGRRGLPPFATMRR